MSSLSPPTAISWGAAAKAGISRFFSNSDHQHGMVSILDIYPIGTVYIAATSIDPNTAFGGTWVALGAGRFLVTQDVGQTEFDVLTETGGAKTVTLDTTMIPSHNHPIPHTHPVDILSGSVSATGGNQSVQGTNMAADAVLPATGASSTANSNNTGGGAAHNNLPPYMVVAAWRRIA